MLTRDILFGMNILTCVLMGITLTLNRMGQAGKALSITSWPRGRLWYSPGMYAGGGFW
jgi:hypothetical protein